MNEDSMEQGRRLASEREDLIARGVNPDDLLIPLAPGGHFPRCNDLCDGDSHHLLEDLP